jgi:hypothetical protein
VVNLRDFADYRGYQEPVSSFQVQYPLLLMLTPVCLLPDAIADLFAQVSCSGKITLADRYGLMAALLDDSLTCQDRELLDRLLRASYRGRLKVVDEISAVFNAKTAELERKIEALILSSCA